MKNRIKDLVGLLILFTLAFAAASASAQQYATTAITLGTNHIIASNSNMVDSATITLTKWDEIAIACTVTSKGANAVGGTVTFEMEHSVDATTWQSLAQTIAVTPVASANVVAITNLDVGPVGYLRFTKVINDTSNAVGLSASWTAKPARYGGYKN